VEEHKTTPCMLKRHDIETSNQGQDKDQIAMRLPLELNAALNYVQVINLFDFEQTPFCV
jgi:hypothetical protein